MWDLYGSIITLDLQTIESLVEVIAKHYPRDEFEELLEYALDQHERNVDFFQNPRQRECYKKCLGKIFWRRSEEARRIQREFLAAHGFDTPF